MERDDLVELASQEIPVGPGPAEGLVERLLLPGSGDARRHDLLREDVERPRRHRRPVEDRLADAFQKRRPLDELIERQREEPPLRDLLQSVPRAPDALEERRDRPRGADLDGEVHVADVDPELERCRGDQGAELPRLEALLRVEAALARKAPVVARHRVLAHQFGQLTRDPLRHLPCVDEHERRAVLGHELGDAPVDLGPLLVGADRAEGGRGDLDAEVELPERTGVDERATTPGADEEPTDLVERLLRGGEPDPLDRRPRQAVEPLEREREVAPPLVPDEGVDFVDDGRPDGREHPPAALAREKEVEGLRGRDEDVRRAPDHRRAVARRRVARPHEHPDLGNRRIGCSDLGERALQVLLDVVRESAQRRNVKDLGLVGELRPLPAERVDRRKECGERLSGPGRRGDERVLARADRRPAVALRGRGFTETVGEPPLDRGVERGEQGHRAGY
jgi:hypothetical protein